MTAPESGPACPTKPQPLRTMAEGVPTCIAGCIWFPVLRCQRDRATPDVAAPRYAYVLLAAEMALRQPTLPHQVLGDGVAQTA